MPFFLTSEVHACIFEESSIHGALPQLKMPVQELMLDLSRCAAMCYRRGGRRRNAALLRMEVAEALAAAGATREAVALMAALVQEVLHEGWLSVAAALLLRLLDCSQPLAAVCIHSACR